MKESIEKIKELIDKQKHLRNFYKSKKQYVHCSIAIAKLEQLEEVLFILLQEGRKKSDPLFEAARKKLVEVAREDAA